MGYRLFLCLHPKYIALPAQHGNLVLHILKARRKQPNQRGKPKAGLPRWAGSVFGMQIHD